MELSKWPQWASNACMADQCIDKILPTLFAADQNDFAIVGRPISGFRWISALAEAMTVPNALRQPGSRAICHSTNSGCAPAEYPDGAMSGGPGVTCPSTENRASHDSSADSLCQSTARRAATPRTNSWVRSCGSDIRTEGHLPQHGGASRDCSARLSLPISRKTILPSTNSWVRTLREAILAGHLPRTAGCPRAAPWPDLGVSRSTVGAGLWLAGGGRLSVVRKVGAGSFVALAAVRPAPRPGLQSAAGLSRRGQRWPDGGLPRRARGGPLLCLQPAGSPPLPQALWGLT